MLAAGIYLRTLRDTRNLTREVVARELGVSVQQIKRWEGGGNDPAASAFVRFVEFVGGDIEEASQLLSDPDVSAEYARQLAEARAKLARMTPEERESTRQRAAALISELEQDPRKLDRWLGYGDRLREE